MATVDRAFAEKLMAGNGFLPEHPDEAPDNPPAIKIVEFLNAWGEEAYGVVFKDESDQDRYERETEYVRGPRVIWRRREDRGEEEAPRKREDDDDSTFVSSLAIPSVAGLSDDPAPAPFVGGGGDFAGAGASVSWDAPSSDSPSSDTSSSDSSSGSDSGSSDSGSSDSGSSSSSSD